MNEALREHGARAVRFGEKSVTMKTELLSRSSSRHCVLQPRSSVKHPAVTTITDSEVLHLVFYGCS